MIGFSQIFEHLNHKSATCFSNYDWVLFGHYAGL